MKLPERFIVVDDDRTSNMICEFALRRFSPVTEIKTFLDPEMALQFIKNSYTPHVNLPTLLFLDINMPIYSGWDFLDIFEDFSTNVKQQFVIYLLSSSIDERDKEKAETNPLVKNLLSKPLSTKVVSDIFNAE